jgi:hypothetical protein
MPVLVFPMQEVFHQHQPDREQHERRKQPDEVRRIEGRYLRELLETAYPHGDDAEDRSGDPQDLPHPVLARQAQIVAR